MNLFVDSFGIYTVFNGTNGVACGQSLRNRWNVTNTGGQIFVQVNKGNRGNPGLQIGFGGGIGKTFPHRSTYIYGIRVDMSCDSGVGGGSEFVSFFNNNQQLITLKINTDGSVLVFGWGNSSFFDVCASSGPVVSAGVLTYIDFHANVTGLTVLTLNSEVYVNGTLVASGSVVLDRVASSLTSLKAEFNRIIMSSGVATNGQCYISDLYLNDDLGGINDTPIANPNIKIDAYPLPNADGSQLDWITDSGTIHYLRVNENPADGDSSYLHSTTNGAIDSWGWQDLVTLSDTINAVQLTLFGRTTDEGNLGVQGTIGNHGAEEQTQTFGLNNDYTYHHQSFDLDPNGNILWTPPNFNAKEFGTKLIAV